MENIINKRRGKEDIHREKMKKKKIEKICDVETGIGINVFLYLLLH